MAVLSAIELNRGAKIHLEPARKGAELQLAPVSFESLHKGNAIQ